MIAAVPIAHALLLAALLFSLGLLGLLLRRNLIFALFSVEIMLNATGLAFVAAGSRWGQPDGQLMFILVISLAAAEAAVGLAIALQVQRRFGTLNLDELTGLAEPAQPAGPSGGTRPEAAP